MSFIKCNDCGQLCRLTEGSYHICNCCYSSNITDITYEEYIKLLCPFGMLRQIED